MTTEVNTIRVLTRETFRIRVPIGARGPQGEQGPPGNGNGNGADLSDEIPQPIGTAAPGDDTEASRADHVHAHGNQLGGTLHAVASGAAAGFESAAHFTKIEGIEALADVTDAANVRAAIPELVTGPGVGIADAVALLDATGLVASRSLITHDAGSIVLPHGHQSAPANGVRLYAEHLGTAIPMPIRLAMRAALDNAQHFMPDGWNYTSGGFEPGTLGGTTLNNFGAGGFALSGGTLLVETPASTSALTRSTRASITSAGTAGSLTTLRGQAQLWQGAGRAGYFLVWRNCGIKTLPATPQLFWGATDRSSLGGDPSALGNCLIFGCDPTDANLKFMHNDGSGPADTVTLGASFPVLVGLTFDGVVHVPSDGTRPYYLARRTDTFAETEGQVANNNWSGPGTAMAPYMAARNGSTASAIATFTGGCYFFHPREIA